MARGTTIYTTALRAWTSTGTRRRRPSTTASSSSTRTTRGCTPRASSPSGGRSRGSCPQVAGNQTPLPPSLHCIGIIIIMVFTTIIIRELSSIYANIFSSRYKLNEYLPIHCWLQECARMKVVPGYGQDHPHAAGDHHSPQVGE